MAMAVVESPMDRLVKGLRNRSRDLRGLVEKLEIGQHSLLSYRALSKNGCNSAKTYKLEEKDRRGDLLDHWVVKVNPHGVERPWDDVTVKYGILCKLHGKIPVPKPFYCSSEVDRRVVGSNFIVMEYVKGKHYDCVRDIPLENRQEALESVMKVLGMLHKMKWDDQDYMGTRHFWHIQAETWDRNYKKVANLDDDDYEYELFTNLRNESKPDDGESSIIHGDMNISNVIFDDEYRIKAFIDWKNSKLGDPMLDVASICMIFLQPRRQQSGYYCYKDLDDLKLLAGPPDEDTPSEDEMLEVYKEVFTRRGAVFHVDVFHYAKAVCCMRFISILKVALVDGLEKHEIGRYLGRNLAERAIECLSLAGDSSYDEYCKYE
jgi:aminoglycoside phosphotransferase (APT) family kinase protein